MFQQYYSILLIIAVGNCCLSTLAMPTLGGYAQEQQVANDLSGQQLQLAGKGLGKLEQVETLSKILGALERSVENNNEDIRIVQVNAKTPTQSDEEEQASSKYAVKRKSLTKKWHKVVDDLIDEELGDNNNKYPNKNKLEKTTKKKRWMSGGANDAEKLTIIMKKPISLEETSGESADGSSNTNLMNSGSWIQDQATNGNNRRRETTEGQRNLNTNDHTRRVLNDQFGIMKESKFTTNNHLGLKGVPKFGSDDEY